MGFESEYFSKHFYFFDRVTGHIRPNFITFGRIDLYLSPFRNTQLSSMKRIANFISISGHPLLTFPLFIMIALYGKEDFSRASLISFLIIGCFIIPVIAWMYFKSRNGSYTNFDVSDKKQRRSLFVFAIPLLLIVTILLFATHQSTNLCISVLFALILLIISQITNYFIKSSLHVSLNIYLAALIFISNYKLGIIVLLYTGLIAWSRIKLGRHTLIEVLSGSIIGILMGFMILVLEKY